jgi:hypothetical protein
MPMMCMSAWLQLAKLWLLMGAMVPCCEARATAWVLRQTLRRLMVWASSSSWASLLRLVHHQHHHRPQDHDHHHRHHGTRR